MGTHVRAAALRGFVDCVASLGGDGEAILRRFRVDPEAVSHDEAITSTLTVGRVLEAAAAELSCPDFGLRLARLQDPTMLGALAPALEHAATIGEALEIGSRFLFVHSPALAVSAGDDPEGAAGVVGLYYGTADPAEHLYVQAIDVGVANFHRILALGATGSPEGRYGLRSVHLPHAPLAPVSTYTDYFGADVRFGRPRAALRVPAALLSAPVDGSNPVLRSIVLDYLESRYDDPSLGVTARVRGNLQEALGTSPPRLETVARWLRLHPRTLQRHLADEGTTFEAVLDDVRRETALRLLTTTDLPLSQVSSLVALTEQSALTRACRRWFGATPTAVRRSLDRATGEARDEVALEGQEEHEHR